MHFDDRVAVVTGGASGIGLGIVRALSKRGMKLVIADLDEQGVRRAVAETVDAGGEAIGQICDVSDPEAMHSLADATLSQFGAVHVLCNNAGVGLPTPAHKMNLSDWRWIIEVNLWGAINGVNAFLPHLEKAEQAHINTTSSLAGLIAPEFMGAYAAAKHGCIGFMTSLERELRVRQSAVRTSVLCPAAVDTNISRTSVLHRPDARQAKDAHRGDRDKGKSIQASLSKGMSPDKVGEILADAISKERFWVMTHPELFKELTAQVDALVSDQTLTTANVGLN